MIDEKQFCENEEAEINASNEYQKELDEHLPHIEKTEYGYVGSVEISTFDKTAQKFQIARNIEKEMCKIILKNGEKLKDYIFERIVVCNEVSFQEKIIVKGKRR